MELTIDEALQQGVTAHKEGKVQEAERIYRAILQVQPAHPDANHNLGVLAVAVNKAEAALPLFKTALESNPKIEQFWLSYIDALIKEKQFEAAKQVIEQGKQQGVDGEKLNSLKAQLVPIPQTENANSASPSQQQLNSLLEHYQAGRYDDAEKLAVLFTKQFPTHQFSWKILGAVFRQTGRKSEAVNANQKSVELDTQDADAHYNLGVTLQEIDRLDEAEGSYRKAVALKSDYTEAHNNLGITLKELGRLEESEASYRQAIALKSDFVEAHNNLGNTLKQLDRLEEAEVSFRQAISLKSDYPEAHSNLGNTLLKQDRLEEAEGCYRQAIALRSDFAEAYSNLSGVLLLLSRLEEAEASLRRAIELQPDYLEARHYLGLLLFRHSQFEKAIEFFKDNDYKNEPRPSARVYLLACYYELNDRSRFCKLLDFLVTQKEINAVIGSLMSRSKIKYGIKHENVFVRNPFEYIKKTDLIKQCNFKDIFVRTVGDILNEKSISYQESQNLLVRGQQTSGNFFQKNSEPIRKIEKIIREEIENYRMQFQHRGEGFLTNWPKDFKLTGWLINMKSGGSLAPHMHDKGWLSGAVYINVPIKKQVNSGNFAVCIDYDISEEGSQENPYEVIDVFTGSFLLFPASLMHYTIPFESNENRIVLAFDVSAK
jgi:tetratricopeptide (TPR) repeat protein